MGANIAESHGLISGKSKSLLVENSLPNLFTRSKKSNKKLDALFFCIGSWYLWSS
jgi:hypothetical protein